MENAHPPYYKGKELQAYREVLDVMGQFLENEEFPGDYAAICRMHKGDYVDEFPGTLYGLRRRWPQRELPSFEEVQRHTALYQCVQALVDTSMHVTELFTECLAPHNPESGWTVCAGMFHPEKMKWSAGSKPAAPAPLQPAAPHRPKEEADVEADLQTVREELDRLRMQLRQKEEEIKHLHNQLEGQKRALQEAQRENQKNAENREELISLRDHVYRSTEQDEAPAAVSPEEMERVIAARRIVIIGGHSNWTYKLKNRFRKWVFLDPKVSGSTDGNLLNKADRVFFFTEIISHSTYYRFVNLVREREIPFGYIHSINIENNIRQIYEETEGGKASSR